LLSESKVAQIISQIISAEFEGTCKSKTFDEYLSIPSHGQSELHTMASSIQNHQQIELQTNKNFPRIGSAMQMVLFPSEENGPQEGQVSRSVNTDAGCLSESKKDVFYVHQEENPEEEYKDVIDYKNPILLRTKRESAEEQNEIHSEISVANNEVPESIQPGLIQYQPIINEKSMSEFNFSVYSPFIMEHCLNKYFYEIR